jgi:hypothetical protein
VRRTLLCGLAIGAAFLFGCACEPIAASADEAPAAAASTPSPAPSSLPKLLQLGGDFYSIDREIGYTYYFEGLVNGAAESKSELLFGRNLWSKHAQIRVQIPVITKYSPKKATYSGLGNIQVSYIYLVDDPRYAHFIQATIVPPTVTYGVQGADTEFQAYYGSKWKWRTGSISAVSEVEQTFIAPPGQKWASFYDLKTALPDVEVARHVRAAAAYEGKVNFASHGRYQSAAGLAVYGVISGNVGLTLYDGWGIGTTGQSTMWRYKMEAAASARL